MFDYSTLPQHMRGPAKMYVENGIKGGGFMNAVFANDLKGAFGRADHMNKAALEDWVVFLQWEVPATCQGSYEIVDAWQGTDEGEMANVHQL